MKRRQWAFFFVLFFLDVSKDFDTISHNIFMEKLSSI